MTNTQPATTTHTDMITLRVPAPTARLWRAASEDLSSALDAISRDIAAAWHAAEDRPAGRTTVTVLTAPRTVLRAFLATLGTLAETEYYADNADTRAADSALTFIARCETTKGLTPHTPEDYRMADPKAQAALDAEIAKAQQEKDQRAAQRAEAATHRDAWQALPREERTARTQRILDDAAAVLGFQRTDTTPAYMIGGTMISVVDGRLYMEVRRLRDSATAQPAVDASREALAAAGWTINNYGTHFYAQAPAEAPQAPQEAAPAVEWTGRVKNHRHGILTLTDGRRVRITHAPHGTQYTYLGHATTERGSATVARANSLEELAAKFATTPAPTSVWVTTEHGERIEYAHIPNGDPTRIAHFLDAARAVPTYRDASTTA